MLSLTHRGCDLAMNLAAGGRQGGTLHLEGLGQEDSGHWAGSPTPTPETWQAASSEPAQEPITCCFCRVLHPEQVTLH